MFGNEIYLILVNAMSIGLTRMACAGWHREPGRIGRTAPSQIYQLWVWLCSATLSARCCYYIRSRCVTRVSRRADGLFLPHVVICGFVRMIHGMIDLVHDLVLFIIIECSSSALDKQLSNVKYPKLHCTACTHRVVRTKYGTYVDGPLH